MFQSVLFWAADHFFSVLVVNVQISTPYVIVLKHIGSVPFIIVLCLPNACHVDLILVLISLSWLSLLMSNVGLVKHNLLLDQVRFYLHILPWLPLQFLPWSLFFSCSFPVHISYLRCPALEALIKCHLQRELLL